MYTLPTPCMRPASSAWSGLTLLQRLEATYASAAIFTLCSHSSFSGLRIDCSCGALRICSIAYASDAVRTLAKPMRAMALLSSVILVPAGVQRGGVRHLQQLRRHARLCGDHLRDLRGVAILIGQHLADAHGDVGKRGISILPA